MGNNGGESFLRQLSVGSSPPPCHNSIFTTTTSSSSSSSSSKRWGTKKKKMRRRRRRSTQMEGEEGGGCGVDGMSVKKRVMVVIDQSTRAKHAMMWALTHMVNRGDILTLLHVVPPPRSPSTRKEKHGPNLAHSLGSLCKACKPEVEVEALVIQGPKLATVLSQVKKLEASVLVLGQSKPSLFSCLFRSSAEDFVEQCIKRAQCLTMAVRKQSKGVGGYLVSTRWQKNFWLLA